MKNKNNIEKIDILFTRASILDKEKDYEYSAINLKKANDIKLGLYPSDYQRLKAKTNYLLRQDCKIDPYFKEEGESINNIFIVGMPRSGSTLLESILSMNNKVNDLGEVNLIEKSFLEWKDNSKGWNTLDLKTIYNNKIKKLCNKSKIVTNKWLSNYQYAGIIASQIPNTRIIHCYRNPLDNILSIYRANFSKANRFSSSLKDCTRVYLDHEKVMSEYKRKYPYKIYDVNYDLLVSQPIREIKCIISWLSWDWDDMYLTPHLNLRSVQTASSVQVRSPINSKSVGGWKKYRKMLKPAIEILKKTRQYKNIEFI